MGFRGGGGTLRKAGTLTGNGRSLKQVKPLAIDLYCGLGGWAEGLLAAGWRVVGIDLGDFSSSYPGEFIQADLKLWNEWKRYRPALVVCSAPCQEFSQHDQPWTRSKNPRPPDLALVDRGFALAALWECPIIQENVRGAQRWLGRSKMNCGPFHLWGDVPAVVPVYKGPKKEQFSGEEPAKRAKIPFELAVWIGRAFYPHGRTHVTHGDASATVGGMPAELGDPVSSAARLRVDKGKSA